MEQFLSDIINQMLILFKGDFNFLHYLTFFVGAIFLIVGTVQLWKRVRKGVFTLVLTLFYVFCFSITATGFASDVSVWIFFFASVVLNLLSWIFAFEVGVKKSFKWLLAYIIGCILGEFFVFVGNVFVEMFSVSENVVAQAGLLLTSLLLCVLVVSLENPNYEHHPVDPHRESWHEEVGW